MNTNVQQLLRLLKVTAIDGGSELRPVGILYHVIRVASGERKKGPAGKESLRPEKKKSSARVGSILFSFQETVLWVLSFLEKKICVPKGMGNRWKNVDEEEEKTDSTSL